MIRATAPSPMAPTPTACSDETLTAGLAGGAITGCTFAGIAKDRRANTYFATMVGPSR